MTLTRRQALLGASALGAAALTPAVMAAPARAAKASSDPGYVLLSLFNNSAFNGQISFCLGGASSHTAEVGEVMYAVQQINKATGNPSDDATTAKDFDAVVQAFVDLGDRMEKLARGAGPGQQVTYRQRMMRASSYAAQALFFVLGGTEPSNEADYYAICQSRWLKAARMFEHPVEEFSVSSPYGQIPCYFFPGGDDGRRRPTLIVSSGSDGQLVECMGFGVTDGLARGYNVVLFEGPGQMSLLFDKHIPFTAQWDKVVGPIVEAVRRRNDVGRVGFVGVSFAGMLGSSAAANVDLDATVLLPAAWNMTLIWGDQKSMDLVKATYRLPAAEKDKVMAGLNAGFAETWPHLPRTIQFDFYKRGEIFSPQVMKQARAGQPVTDYYGLLESVLPFQFEKQFRRISSPIMLTRNEGDTSFNGGSGNPPTPTTGQYDQPTYAWGLLTKVPPKHKRFVNFTAAQGASLHDQPLAPQFANEVMFGWLDEYL